MAFSALMIDLLNVAVLHLVKTKLVLARTLLKIKKWHFESPRVEYGGKVRGMPRLANIALDMYVIIVRDNNAGSLFIWDVSIVSPVRERKNDEITR